MRLSLLTGTFLCGIISILPAQVVLHTSPDTTKQNTGKVKVSVINPNGKQPMAYEGNSLHTDSVQQALKINPCQFPRGEFAFYYEYRLSDAFSAEAGLGVTYVDYIYELFGNDGRFLFKAQEGNNAHFQSGFAAHAQLRYYPSRYETAITGFYFAPDFSRRNWRMQYFVPTGLISEPHDINRSWTDVKLQIGYQDADPYDSMFWEWYLSAGLRLIDEDIVNGAGADAVFSHDHYWVPVISGGIKLGFTI